MFDCFLKSRYEDKKNSVQEINLNVIKYYIRYCGNIYRNQKFQ